ncbi:MAG TPA: response regulator [Candidatus Binataceae bacterium]|nr:response regulator [Candidatus Binataceae bacterium]
MTDDHSRAQSGTTAMSDATAVANHPPGDIVLICAEFLARLSHETRTPLSSILGVSQMMLEGDFTDAQREFAETVAESAAALASSADAIADFAQCLGLQKPELHDLLIKLNRTGRASPGRRSNGNGVNASTHAANPSRRGVDVYPQPDRTGFNPAANFSTRVPADTAKLIRILVVEDHLVNQRVILRMLARLGYNADAVNNGAEAISALRRSPYDIVLMDCQMPEVDGYEATRMIRKSAGRFQSTPIIAVTANAMEGDREKCLASGMSDYMSKPVLAHTLATTLEKWILPDAAAGTAPATSSPAAAPHDASEPAPEAAPEPQPLPADAQAARDEAPNLPEDLGPAVDAAALETLRSMDAGEEGFLTKIIDLFLADSSGRIAALETAAATRDGDALKRLAHALKGSCGHFGATRLAMLCRKLEQIGAEQPVGDASVALRELIAESERVRVALEQARNLAPANPAQREDNE